SEPIARAEVVIIVHSSVLCPQRLDLSPRFGCKSTVLGKAGLSQDIGVGAARSVKEFPVRVHFTREQLPSKADRLGPGLGASRKMDLARLSIGGAPLPIRVVYVLKGGIHPVKKMVEQSQRQGRPVAVNEKSDALDHAFDSLRPVARITI